MPRRVSSLYGLVFKEAKVTRKTSWDRTMDKLAEALLKRPHTHLQSELLCIRTGKSSDGLGAKMSRDKFVAMGGVSK